MLSVEDSRNLLCNSMMCSADNVWCSGFGRGDEAKKEAPTFFTSFFSTWILYRSSTYGANEPLESSLFKDEEVDWGIRILRAFLVTTSSVTIEKKVAGEFLDSF